MKHYYCSCERRWSCIKV